MILHERAGVPAWPIPGPVFGKVVRFFHPVGPFVVRQEGDDWIVRDQRLANHRGGPDVGRTFTSRADAVRFIQQQEV